MSSPQASVIGSVATTQGRSDSPPVDSIAALAASATFVGAPDAVTSGRTAAATFDPCGPTPTRLCCVLLRRLRPRTEPR